MARRSAWVLTLVLACASAVAGTAEQSAGQARPEKAAQASSPAGKDAKDKPQSAAATAASGENRERWKWWLYDRAELGITDQQSQEINRIFESTITRLREARQQLDKAEDELSTTIKEHKADVATVSLMLDRAESARTQHNKLRVLMLYRIDLVLSAEQRAKVEALRERWERERNRDRDRREPTPGHRRNP